MARSPRRRLAAAAALLLAAAASLGVAVGGAPLGPATARAMGSLPACRYDDILTTPRLYVDWSETLVDTILRIPSTYAPPDLVPVSEAGLAGSGKVRAVALADLTEMTAAAVKAGTPIAVQSAYRSYSQQKATFQGWVDKLGYKAALKVSARPGHSEHQLGLAIDFRSDQGGPPWNGTDWALSPAGSWMAANAWRYGWVLSYPKNSFSTVCYSYEPWHYRYLGRAEARVVHDTGLTIRAYLWANFTTATVPPVGAGSTGKPTASGSPAAPGSPLPSPSASPSPSPTTEATTPVLPTAPAPQTPGPTPEPSPEPGPLAVLADPAFLPWILGGGAILALVGIWLVARARLTR